MTSMSVFQQCKSCRRVLLSSDPVIVASHSCLSSSPEKGLSVAIGDETAVGQTNGTDMPEKETLGLLSLPDLRVLVTGSPVTRKSSNQETTVNPVVPRRTGRERKIRKQSSEESSLGEEEPNKSKKRKRVRYDGHDSNGEPLLRQYRYDCNMCPGKFYSKVEYDRHMNVHSGSRKLMKCIVCLRMFNKRDSLNGHYAAHENAEEREEKLNLMHSWPQKTKGKPYARIRQACKYCLLVHTNQKSFVNHMKSDHGGDSSLFPCHLLDNCTLTFTKIKDLLKHAKERHPLQFYGKFTLNRIKGTADIGVRSKYTLVAPTSENNNEHGVNPKSRLPNNPKPKQRKKKTRRVDHFESSDSDNEITDFTGTIRTSSRRGNVGTTEGLERTVELERVHIVDAKSENSQESVKTIVKKENSRFYYQDELDPFLMYELANQANGSLSDCDKNDAVENAFDKDTDSVPVVLAVKTEPVLY